MNDDLLVKYLAGEADREEEEAIFAWISERAGNERYFRHFKMIWEESEALALHSNTDENAAWERFRDRVSARGSIASHARPLTYWIRIAALIFLICATGGIALSVYLGQHPVELVQVQSHGNALSDTLPDGSVVIMNRNSKITYPSRFAKTERNIQMDGEAFFKVAPDKKHPFIIKVDNVTVTVVGTSFNIKSRYGKTEVIVETGIVQVVKHNDRVELKAGEKVIAGQKGSLEKGMNTSRLYHSYADRKFICRDTPLQELIAAVNDVYGADIVIANRDLASLSITNTFSNDPLDRILLVITETFKDHNIKIEREGNKIILK